MSERSATHERELTDPAPHLAVLVPGEWAVWRWFVLRGAGFPARLVDGLCDGDCGARANAVVEAERMAQTARESAIAAVNAALDEASASRDSQPHRERFGSLVAALRALRSGKRATTPEASLEPFFDQIQKTQEAVADSRRVFEAEFLGARERQSATISRIAADSRFQEAVIWQNQAAFETAIRALSEYAPERDKKRRQHEQLAASYLQRYCVKNDTIGFFGPVAWGQMERAGPAITAIPGESLIAERRVYFETWAIDEIASALSNIEGMRQWIPPRLPPYARVEAGGLYLHGKRHVSLNPLAAETLLHCDGSIAAREIPGRVRRNPFLDRATDAEIEKALLEFAEQGILIWRFAVPLEANPDDALRTAIAAIGSSDLRGQALAALDSLEERRGRVRAAAGNPRGLRRALGDLDSAFEKATGKVARRHAGSMYTGRTPIYEDCRRDFDIRVSPALLEPMAPALSLVLASCRWLVASMAAAFEQVLESGYDELIRTLRSDEAPADAFWLKIQRVLLAGTPAAAGRVEAAFKEKWAKILTIPPESHECRFETRDLAGAVAAAFPAVHGPAFVPRYFCPDLMIATRDVRAIERGDALFVLGEIHLANNTLSSTLFLEMHPEPHEVEDAVRWDFPRRRLCLINSRQWPRVTTRTNTVLLLDRDISVAATSDAVPASGRQAYPISSFIVKRGAAGLVLRERKGPLRFPILEAFAEPLYGVVMNKARILADSDHVPRIAIDKLVIARESWTESVSKLSFACEKEEHRRYLGMRRWAADKGMPPVLFVKTPVEVKPVYVHLDSPIYVESACKMIRGLGSARGPDARVAFSEMLPRAEDLWLVDASENRYTSELRFTILDLRARAAESRAAAGEGA